MVFTKLYVTILICDAPQVARCKLVIKAFIVLMLPCLYIVHNMLQVVFRKFY